MRARSRDDRWGMLSSEAGGLEATLDDAGGLEASACFSAHEKTLPLSYHDRVRSGMATVGGA